MTAWFRRQDAVQRFSLYLRWQIPGYVTESGEVDEEKTECNDGNDSEVEGDIEDGHLMSCQTVYHTAKWPALPHVDIRTITNEFGTTDFLVHLDSFLHNHHIMGPASVSENSEFPVYNCLSLQLPPIPEVSVDPIKDSVIATKGVLAKLTR